MSRTTSTTINDLRRLAEQATNLARAIRAAGDRLRRTDDEPTRRAGFRLDEAVSAADRVTGELITTADYLTRIANRGTCAADWGLCPEHGNTLAGSGGRSWCQRIGCRRRWDHDRAGLPCTEPAAYQVRDTAGGETLLCTGHANDARQRLIGARLTPITTGRKR
ncbi:hypothetical protein JQS43_24325 [Natronosporangium hydrolyticum]|uniref:Uncharacterized protein n=1 Tax=Natronosporangium hydrolyticum TaxID=2811111 RepID=A0A895YEI5_9ACTN|nr:hypothetical protein [Natronosporangium hydrolyticum]QSB14562.1 hypothetical protein JQS43_24325 [Natronosporangium hydrolyticum]